MQTEWLVHAGHERLLLFFNGWGMDVHSFAFLPSLCFDVVAFSDYADSSCPDVEIWIREYEEIYVCAWSMGVAIAQKVCTAFNFPVARALAINGTPCLVHDRYGIPCKIFEKTEKSLNEEGLQIFLRHMFMDTHAYKRFQQSRSLHHVASLLYELQIMRKLAEDYQSLSDADSIFTHTVISRRDRIVPANNQRRYWKSLPVFEVESGHFPFYNWQSWDNIIDMIGMNLS